MEIEIRRGKKEDLSRVLELIKELALYEKAPDEVTITVEQLEKDGFGENPLYYFFVAEKDGHIIGLSLYYFRYSTWKGTRLYLEDIIVTESERGNGIGKNLFDITIKEALETECTGMMWQVLDWNEPAITFYKNKFNAHLDPEWINCHLMSEDAMVKALDIK